MSDEERDLEAVFEIPTEEVLEQRIIEFAGDDVSLARCESGVYLSLPNTCKAIGLAVNMQARRLVNTDELRPGLRMLSLRTRGGFQDTTCLNVDDVPNWLIGVETSRTRPAFRAKLNEYQHAIKPFARGVFAQVLGIPSLATSAPPTLAPEQYQQLTTLAQNYGPILDVTRFILDNRDALQKILIAMPEMQMKFDQAQQLITSLATEVKRIDERTQGLRSSQEAEMQEFVKSMIAQTRNLPKPLTFNIIWGRIKHRFRVGSYLEIPDTSFDEAMQFLKEELRAALGRTQPEQGGLFS